jgi:hypothetical protein
MVVAVFVLWPEYTWRLGGLALEQRLLLPTAHGSPIGGRAYMPNPPAAPLPVGVERAGCRVRTAGGPARGVGWALAASRGG